MAVSGTSGGILSTTPQNGPGFRVYWDNENLAFSVRRDSDSIGEWAGMWHTHLFETYSYDQWFHCTVTHKVDSCSLGNNLDVYLDGTIVTTINKFADTWTVGGWQNLEDYNGNVDLGSSYVGTHSWGTGNFELDDLIIWEYRISSADVKRLYLAYL